MKVLILGAGAMGGYFGARLVEVGIDIAFLVREGRAALLSRSGLVINSELGNFRQQVATVSSASTDGHIDLVLLACKAYDLPAAIDAIAPVVDAGACVLPLLNGMSVYEQLDTRFGRERVLGGVAYIATSLNAKGEIDHEGGMDKLIVGARHASQSDLAAGFVEKLSRGPGVRELSAQVEQDLWDKWVMLAAGAALTCLMRANVGQIMATVYGTKLMTKAIDECANVARASGHPLSEGTIGKIRSRLLDRNSQWAASMMRDIAVRATNLEVDSIIGDMARRAESLRIPALLIETAHSHLQAYLLTSKR